MEPGRKALQALMEFARPPDLDLVLRPMFGGMMGDAAGRVFTSLSSVGLALEMSGADHAALSAVPGVKPLRHGPDDPPSKSDLQWPDAMLSDPAGLRAGIARGAAGLKPTTKTPPKKPMEDR